MRTVTFTMVTGKMTKPMDLVNTPILTVLNMRVIGSMIRYIDLL